MEQFIEKVENPHIVPNEATILAMQYKEAAQDVESNKEIMDRLFGKIVKLTQPEISRVVGSKIRDEHNCQDVIQRTYLKVLNNIEKFDGRSQINTWFHRIAVNTAYDAIKEETNRRKKELLSGELVHSTLEHYVDIAEEIVSNDRVKKIYDTLIMNSAISDRDKKIWIWRSRGMKYARIAIILGVSVGVAKTAYSRTNKKVKENLEK